MKISTEKSIVKTSKTESGNIFVQSDSVSGDSLRWDSGLTWDSGIFWDTSTGVGRSNIIKISIEKGQ